MATVNLFSPRKIGVCGSSTKLTSEAVKFCQALGRCLARHPQAKIISGGTKKRKWTLPGHFAAEWWIVTAAQKVMAPDVVSERIVTVIRAGSSGALVFSIGAEQYPRGRTSEARRISFVRGLDGLIAVGGGGGTRQELALAIEHDIPVLPVPTFGGAAHEYWHAYRRELMTALRIDDTLARHWEKPAPTDPRELCTLADGMVETFFSSLPRRCFVIMPFHEDFNALYDRVIEPAIRAAGDEPIRLDRLGAPGDVKKQIDDGIRSCEYAIAVLDHLRPNVLYEVGLAHGRDKITILLNRQGSLDGKGLAPFDLSTQQRLEYETLDETLLERVNRLITSVPQRSHSTSSVDGSHT